MAAGLRRIAYAGKDADADKAFRSISDLLNFFQKLPTIDGVSLDGIDFSGDSASDKAHALNHKLGRKARGIFTTECRPIADAVLCPNIPIHDARNSSETNDTAMVFMTSDMAAGYIWSFWIW